MAPFWMAIGFSVGLLLFDSPIIGMALGFCIGTMLDSSSRRRRGP